MTYNASYIDTEKKLTLAPIVGHMEETKPFARASKCVYQPDAGLVDEKSNSSLSKTAIQSLRARGELQSAPAQHGIQKFQATGPRKLTIYGMQATYLSSIWRNNTAVLDAQLVGNL